MRATCNNFESFGGEIWNTIFHMPVEMWNEITWLAYDWLTWVIIVCCCKCYFQLSISLTPHILHRYWLSVSSVKHTIPMHYDSSMCIRVLWWQTDVHFHIINTKGWNATDVYSFTPRPRTVSFFPTSIYFPPESLLLAGKMKNSEGVNSLQNGNPTTTISEICEGFGEIATN